MPSSSARAQVEPLAALVAVFALGVGLSVYVGALDATLPALSTERERAPTALDRFVSASSSLGSIHPPLDRAGETARPTGYELNATLRTTAHTWGVGPPTVNASECARRRVSVRSGPGRVRAGRLEVCVWPAA